MDAITLKNGELLVDKQVQSVMSVSKISAKQIRDYIDSRTPQPLIMKKKSLFGKSVVFWENSPAGRAKPFPFMLLSGVQSLSIFIFQHGVTPYCSIQSFKFCLFLYFILLFKKPLRNACPLKLPTLDYHLLPLAGCGT